MRRADTSPEREPPPPRRVLLAALLLAAAVLAAYWGVWENDFVNFDDDEYVTENQVVRQGLGAAGVRWAFTSAHAGNWHPLTWLSHMLDVQLFDLAPGGHHLVSALLHALNGALLFVALLRLSRAFWPALLTAALFALHPLRVESVAWVSERKDVLSGTFFVLTLLAYEAWVRRGGRLRYALLCGALACGLMAKPMLVTVPCVLLLLDFWPLRRELGARLVLEKLPLFALVAASAVVTAIVQARGGALDSLGFVPLGMRIANAATAYWAYLGLTVWPLELGALYPHPLSRIQERVATWTPATIAALSGLVLVTLAVLLLARRRREVAVGWLWYVGMLVPVIGLVQVGVQAWADRYTYLPSIGCALALVYGGRELARRRPALGRPLVGGALVVLAALAVRTQAQVRTWRDSRSLWTRTLEVTRDNYVAHANLGSALADLRLVDEAEQEYRRALAINPYHADANNGLGYCLAETGRFGEALTFLERALAASPTHWEAHNNVGLVHARQGRFQPALESFERANELHPHSPAVLSNLGGALAELAGSRTGAAQRELLEQAARRFEQALALDPELADARANLARLRRMLGQQEEPGS